MEIEATMTSDNTNIHAQSITKHSGIGKRLKTARESLRLSEKEAAARLHLSQKIIPIMENEDFNNGPPATFMRGYLRSYARMLNISENEVNAAILQLESSIPRTPEPCAPPILNTQPIHQRSRRYLRGMTYVVVPVLALLVGIWWSSHSKDILTAIKPIAATLSANVTSSAPKSPAAATPEPQTTPAPEIAANTSVSNPAPTTAPTVAATPASPATPVANPPANVTPQGTAAPEKTSPEGQDKSATDTADMEMAQPEPGLEQNDSGEDSDNHRNIASDDNDKNVY